MSPTNATSPPRPRPFPDSPGLRSTARHDAQVRALQARGRPVIATDGEALRRLAPDLIIAQDLCDVCAVVDGDLRAITAVLDPPPRILSLRARTLDGIFADIEAVGAAIDRSTAARDLVAEAKRRLARLRSESPPNGLRPTVIAVEWLEPLFLAGHWVPELISIAGGRDIGAEPGSHSVVREWSEIAGLDPDLIVVMLCGFDIERGRLEWDRFIATERGGVAAGLRRRIGFIDGNAHTSRPGPRVVDGAERIAALLRRAEDPTAAR